MRMIIEHNPDRRGVWKKDRATSWCSCCGTAMTDKFSPLPARCPTCKAVMEVEK